MFLLDCPNCKKKLKVPESAIGKKARCPACGGTLEIRDRASASINAAVETKEGASEGKVLPPQPPVAKPVQPAASPASAGGAPPQPGGPSPRQPAKGTADFFGSSAPQARAGEQVAGSTAASIAASETSEAAPNKGKDDIPWYAMFFFAAVLVFAAVACYFALSNLEQNGGQARLPWFVALAYYIGGKWGASVLLVLLALLPAYLGFDMLQKKRQAASPHEKMTDD